MSIRKEITMNQGPERNWYDEVSPMTAEGWDNYDKFLRARWRRYMTEYLT
jgi:hypothetical protein